MRTLPFISILMMLTGITIVSESQSISSAIAHQLFGQDASVSSVTDPVADRGSGRRESQAFFSVDEASVLAQRGSGRCDTNPPVS